MKRLCIVALLLMGMAPGFVVAQQDSPELEEQTVSSEEVVDPAAEEVLKEITADVTPEEAAKALEVLKNITSEEQDAREPGMQEVEEEEQVEEKEPAASTPVATTPSISSTPAITPTTPLPYFSPRAAWHFIEDELLLLPSYASMLFSPLKLLAGVGAVSAMNKGMLVPSGKPTVSSAKSSLKEKKGVVYNSATFSSYGQGKDKEHNLLVARPWLQTCMSKVPFTDEGRSPLLYKALLVVGAVGAYKLAGWTIDTVLHGLVLRRFLLSWPKINRERTPYELRAYLDKEYEQFVQDGWSYIFWRTKKVISFVEMSHKLYKKNIRMTYTP